MTHKSEVLESKLSGSWYAADPAELSAEIQGYLGALVHEQLDNVMAVILPHAGYQYSGLVMASGINQVVGGSFSRVIVIGPSHHVSMLNQVSIPGVKQIKTPLGALDLDRDFIEQLRCGAPFISRPEAHAEEHSVQIQLPFLQEALGAFKVVPLVVGQLDAETARRVGRALLQQMDKETLVVVSSDFTHYGAAFDYVPFTEDVAENLDELDVGAFKHIQAKDVAGFLSYVEETGATICGRSAIAVLLSMLPEEALVRMLKYDTSGHITGDWSRCVSYMSVAVTGRWKVGAEIDAAEQVRLSEDERFTLLELARETLEHRLAHGGPPTVEALGMTLTPAMKVVKGAFVSLKWHGQLRGCIGEIFPERPLFEAVMDHAVNAGVNDPRFSPVSNSELSELEFEISALTVPKDVESYKDIVIGKHGVVLRKDECSAVFLPQVAPEQGWGLTEMLSHLAMKAGLDASAWQEDCHFQVFEAEVFCE